MISFNKQLSLSLRIDYVIYVYIYLFKINQKYKHAMRKIVLFTILRFFFFLNNAERSRRDGFFEIYKWKVKKSKQVNGTRVYNCV